MSIFLRLLHLSNSEENLRAALGRMGVGSRAMEDVLDKVRNRHYQVVNYQSSQKFASTCLYFMF